MATRIPEEVLALIPARFVERHRIVPLREANGVVTVVHPEGVDRKALDELALLLDVEVAGVVEEEARIQELIRINYGIGAPAIESLLRADREAGTRSGSDGAHMTTQDIGDVADEASMVFFVNQLLQSAQADGATDIHIEPFENRMRVRLRIDGMLHELQVPADVHRYHAAIVSRLKVMAHLDIAERRLPQDGRIRAHLGGADLDFRVSILPTPFGETVDIRLLANATIRRGLDALGFQPRDLAWVEQALQRPHGVILVTGPTGSGKTTTLYSFLSELNVPGRKIITIEDPIEYNLEGITQIQVHPRIDLGFARGLRSMLRHDPDIMMVGEIRDQETAETVIRVALTGHLVFSTIHTNDAPSTPARLMDMGIEPYLVASSVEGIIAQRLVRTLCPSCRERDTRWTADLVGVAERVRRTLWPSGEAMFWRGRGCDECRQTGFRGRMAVFEVLPISATVRQAMAQRMSAAELTRIATQAGWIPLRIKGLELAGQGVTSVDEVLRVAATDTEEVGD